MEDTLKSQKLESHFLRPDGNHNNKCMQYFLNLHKITML